MRLDGEKGEGYGSKIEDQARDDPGDGPVEAIFLAAA